jgi:hypothetical protein
MSVISFTLPATLPLGKLSNWLRSWVGSTAGLNAVEMVKNLLPLPEIEPRPFSPQLIAIPPLAQEAFIQGRKRNTTSACNKATKQMLHEVQASG